MKQYFRVSAIVTFLVGAALTASAQMVPLGDYTNQKFTTEHCVGYEVQLWKMNEQLYGMLLHCDGMSGDTPVGYIDHVVWNATTGKLTFDAKLTTGMDIVGTDNHETPAKDYYKFDGTMTALLLSGKMSHEDMAQDHHAPVIASVTMKIDKAATKSMTKYPAVADWQAGNADVMSYRGPKW
jgi:hypothetical protein